MERQRVVITKNATAGSSESNDIMIMMSKGEGKIDIELDSVVKKQYGDSIEKVIKDTLISEGVDDVKVVANDKGALDFTIRARVKACIQRGSD